jgi:hypothetical protein
MSVHNYTDVSVSCQFRISAVRAVSDTNTRRHVYFKENDSHIRRTERTVLIRNGRH